MSLSRTQADETGSAGNARISSGLVFNIQRYSLHDGPGIRTTVFLKGCPLDCFWCHNPEGKSARPEIIRIESRCIRCGACRTVCPAHEAPGTASQGCVRCGACVQACPTAARQQIGRWMSLQELLLELSRDRLFYDESGGGVTFSGGEPLFQYDFLKQALCACRARDIHTALDTCGYASCGKLLELVPLVHLFLYDLKLLDEEEHRRWTGVSNEEILKNLQALAQAGASIRVRVPVIPQVNDDPVRMRQLADFCAATPGLQNVSLLPYHATGRVKLLRLGRPDPLEGVVPPSPQRLAEIAALFSARGLSVRIGA